MDLAFQLLAIMLFFVSLGLFLDKQWHTGPWLTLLGMAVGMTLGLMGAVKRAMSIQIKKPTSKDETPDEHP